MSENVNTQIPNLTVEEELTRVANALHRVAKMLAFKNARKDESVNVAEGPRLLNE
jgi:hypothetical protein